jgi:peptidoglycan/LPS O-acetylase OafA/YrhL
MVRRLLYLNGLAVLAVVFYHASAWGYISMFWWTDRYRPVTVPNYDQLGSLTYYGLRFVEQLIIFGIPTFLFVSGFFIAFATGRNKTTVGWNVVGIRIKNLVIPYLIWSLLIIFSLVVQGNVYSLGEFVKTILLGQAADPYYFVPLLVQFYLLSPLIVLLIKANAKLFLSLAALLQVLVLISRYADLLGLDTTVLDVFRAVNMNFLVPGQIFWFSFGIFVGFFPDKLQQFLHRFRWPLLTGLAVTFILGMIEWEILLNLSGQDWSGPRETLIDHFYAGSFILTYLAFDKVLFPFSSQLQNLGSKSYGVYLIHSSVLQYTARIIYHIMPWIFAYQFVFQAILIILGLGVPLLLMALVNKSPVRKYYDYAFGH